jgi:protein SCO1
VTGVAGVIAFLRRRWLLAGLAVLVVALAVAAGLAGAQALARNGHPAAPSAQTGPAGTGRSAFTLNRRVPDLPLEDAQGRPVSLAAFRGHVVMLVPEMTLCQETCPITTGTLLEVKRDLAAGGLTGKVQIITVTDDPWRDTPARLRAYHTMIGQNLGEGWPWLTGTVAQVSRFWSFFGVGFGRQPEGKPPGTDWMTGRPLTFDVWHTDAVFFIDKSGAERSLLLGMGVPGHPIPARLTALLNSQGQAELKAAAASGGWTAGQVMATVRDMLARGPG